jgi:hypothetical protein
MIKGGSLASACDHTLLLPERAAGSLWACSRLHQLQQLRRGRGVRSWIPAAELGNMMFSITEITGSNWELED